MNKLNDKQIKEAYIKSLKNGCTRAEAGEASGASHVTIWNWKNKDPAFSKAIDTALEARIQVVEDALFNAATKGSKGKNMVIAQIFYLKNRGKGQWKDKQEMEFIIPKIVKQNTFIQAGEEPKIIEEEEKEEVIEGEVSLISETLI